MYKENGICITSAREEISDLDSLPFADRSLIDYEKYRHYIGDALVKNAISLQASRGCPYGCLYCHKIWPKKHHVRSAENIYEEIKLYYDIGVRRFSFFDDIFNLNTKNGIKFFELILKNGLNAHLFFPNGLRGDILTRTYIDLMVKAGTISISLALETASPRLQKLIGKNLDIVKFRENIEYIIQSHPHVIVELETMHGFPTETEQEAWMTLDFIKSLKWIHFPYINILKIFPNTEMAKLANQNGIPDELIREAANLGFHQLPDTLPFEKSFTLKYQTDFLKNYFLLKERLCSVLPFQMKIATENELSQKYNSYLPFTVDRLEDLLSFAGICIDQLAEKNCLDEDSIEIPNFNEKIESKFQVHNAEDNALKVLLLDLSQFFSRDTDMLYDVVEPPLGLMNLLTYLNKYLGAKISGKIAKSRIDFDSLEALKLIWEEFKPDVIGIRTLTMFKNFFHNTVKNIRNWGFTGPIIAGGPYATSDYQMVLNDPLIDVAVLGEGEITLAELIEKIIENEGRLPIRKELDSIAGIAYSEQYAVSPHRLIDDERNEILNQFIAGFEED